ncbi:hypothetical protein Ancab_007503, partial [Ancistrocladus abbreviatus]
DSVWTASSNSYKILESPIIMENPPASKAIENEEKGNCINRNANRNDECVSAAGRDAQTNIKEDTECRCRNHNDEQEKGISHETKAWLISSEISRRRLLIILSIQSNAHAPCRHRSRRT